MGKRTDIGDVTAELYEANDGSRWITIESDSERHDLDEKDDAFLFGVFKTIIEADA